jgi:Flp pilus assembly secretin CpaC
MFDALNQPRPQRRKHTVPLVLGALATLCLMAAIPAAVTAQDQGSALVDVLSGGKRAKETRTIQEHMDAWLTFNKDITAIASADDAVLRVPKESVQKRQVRLVSAAVGRTVITLTYADGSTEQLVFTVKRDLSVLETAMKSIHPSIEVDIAPDRDAIVLTGLVPDGSYSSRAAQAASDYANSSRTSDQKGGNGKVINLIRVQEIASNLEQRLKAEIELFGGTGVSVRRIQQGSAADDTKDVFVVAGTMPDNVGIARATMLVRSAVGDRELTTPRVLVQMSSADLGESIESVIERAIHEQVRAPKVKVSRVAPPDPSGDSDILVLTGTVPNQTTLIQALTIASKVFQQQQIVKRKRDGEDKRVTEITAAGSTIISETIPLRVVESDKDIRASADESGALRRTETRNAGDSALLGVFSAGGQSSVGGTDFNSLINNQIDTNIARAKVIELAEGRIVSFLVVEDLPQVRVDIKLYELNRTALLEWDSNLKKAGAADFDTNGINPNSVSRDADGTILTNANGDPVLGSEGTDIANVLTFLEGGLGNTFQVGGGHFAVDAAFRLLETQGVARSIANPTLTVLSGELAAFGDGGSVAVTKSITSNVGGINGSAAVSESVEKLRFGVQLAVRPLVDENGWITLDVVPSVSNPDFQLTQLVRVTTGTPQDTVAFSERSMRTSARLHDGETLLIGGLQDRSRKDTLTDTPGISKIPIIGWLFQDKSFEDKDRELVISLNPSIVRDPPKEARLWAYPSAREMMPRLRPPAPPPPPAQTAQPTPQQPAQPAQQQGQK